MIQRWPNRSIARWLLGEKTRFVLELPLIVYPYCIFNRFLFPSIFFIFYFIPRALISISSKIGDNINIIVEYTIILFLMLFFTELNLVGEYHIILTWH